MPLPTPGQDESQSDFVSRCLGNENVQNDSSDHEQAVAICMSQWRNREPKSMAINDKLLKAIKSRGSKQEPFEFGILTADRWVLNLQDQIGLDNCYKFACKDLASFGDVLSKAAKTLTYSNSDMVVEMQLKNSDLDGTELPKNTLMVFRHVLTSSNKDRDGDILRSSGMEIDPSMLLLWQHVHTLPIGKSIKVLRQDDKSVEMISAIVDMNELSHDAAVMIDNQMGRFSHGFRALEFEEMKSEDGDFDGFDVKRAEIMEESLVSVPANVDAETQEVLLSLVEGGKLTSPIMKEYGKNLREKQELVIPGISYSLSLGEYSVDFKGSTADLKVVHGMGLIGGNEDEDKSTKLGTEERTGDDGSSEETDVKTVEDETEENTEVQEVKRKTLDGSWEMIAKELESQSKRHLVAEGIDIGERDYIYIVATFSESVVICVEKAEYSVPDEFRYFKVGWKMADKKLKLTAGHEQVELVTTAETKKSPQNDDVVGKATIVILTESTEAQKRALISQLTTMLPSKQVEDYKELCLSE